MLICILSKIVFFFRLPLLLDVTQKQPNIFVSDLVSFFLWSWGVPEYCTPKYDTLAYGLYLAKSYCRPAEENF